MEMRTDSYNKQNMLKHPSGGVFDHLTLAESLDNLLATVSSERSPG